MARANAANVSVYAGTLEGLARFLTSPIHERVAGVEPWLRRAVPVMVGIFLATLATIATLQALELRDQAIDEAIAEVEMLAATISADLAVDAEATDGATRPAVVERSFPARALIHGGRVLVTNPAGEIIAALPQDGAPAGLLSDYLGPAQPLTIFAEKAGVLRIVLADGQGALASVHNLKPPFGQVAIVAPIDGVLAEWRAASARSGLLLFSCAFVILVVASAYFWQSRRAREADLLAIGLRNRIDTALSRGRCGLWDWDIARGRLYWSSSMYEILGLEPQRDYLSFGDVNALVHPEDGDLATMAEMLAASQTNTIDHAFRIRNGKGEWIWLRARAERVRQRPHDGPHLVGIALDITDQKKLVEKTKTVEMRLRDAIETISEAFVLWDAENRLVMCNSKFQRLHNLPPDAVDSGTPYAVLMAKGSHPLIHSRTAPGIRPQTGVRSYEVRLADGRWLQINERPTKDGGYVSVGTDITTLKRHEEQLLDSERRLMATVADLRKSRQVLETQARQLSELADKYFEQKAEAESANQAKSQFLANMSHELRTPLNAIIGFAEMMEQQTFGALGCQKYLDYCIHIRDSGQHLHGVISDVLDMSRLEAGRVLLEQSRFEVEPLIAQAIDEIRVGADAKRITIGTAIVPDTFLRADRSAVARVLIGLLHNAVKFTPPEGRINVRAERAGTTISLYVEDTGIGISNDALARLGRPFEQIDSPLQNGNKGSGLGLAIARSLVKLHGGALTISSTVGVGTSVHVELPIAPAECGDHGAELAA
jgi:two-component system cell cycle sensor histidine kinase PleC